MWPLCLYDDSHQAAGPQGAVRSEAEVPADSAASLLASLFSSFSQDVAGPLSILLEEMNSAISREAQKNYYYCQCCDQRIAFKKWQFSLKSETICGLRVTVSGQAISPLC